jgi:hypothetical protein
MEHQQYCAWQMFCKELRGTKASILNQRGETDRMNTTSYFQKKLLQQLYFQMHLG